ncbi:hypothetical protein STEG23_000996, partial [Scotinomys teguina]
LKTAQNTHVSVLRCQDKALLVGAVGGLNGKGFGLSLNPELVDLARLAGQKVMRSRNEEQAPEEEETGSMDPPEEEETDSMDPPEEEETGTMDPPEEEETDIMDPPDN